MSAPKQLCLRTLGAIVDRVGLTELTGDAGPYRVLRSAAVPDPVGELRVFTGGKGVAKAVYVGIAVPAIGLDSHMVFAFTGPGSAVPHFTLDSVAANGYHAFHLDLIPRAELASHLPYVDHCFTPLTAVFEDVQARDGLTPAAIGPRQRALMSPWMCVNRATPEAFPGIGDAVDAYREHWSALVSDGLPDDVLADVADTDLARRDARNRAALFSREVDPVWDSIARLLGDEQTEQVRLQLVDDEVGE